ncbi:MAG: glycosyltransferase family 2 protein [Candidatus Levybacteria bacterium]|nr:glycosyltransferase family 2 protein [Candidatus Levybacteria bacterium]
MFNFQSNSKTNNFQIIQNEKNVGFSKGNNIGASAAKGKYLFFLNSDTKFQNTGLLGMVDFMDKNKEIGVLGARLKNFDGSKQRSVGKFYNIFNTLFMLLGAEKLGFLRSSPNKIISVDWVSGAAFMIRSELFKMTGGFDEKLFMYMEDMELCFRAKKAGYKVFFYPEVNIAHKELGSSNRTFAIVNIYKGLLYFYKKHKSNHEYLLVKFLLYTKAVIMILVGSIIKKSYLVITYKKAIQF